MFDLSLLYRVASLFCDCLQTTESWGPREGSSCKGNKTTDHASGSACSHQVDPLRQRPWSPHFVSCVAVKLWAVCLGTRPRYSLFVNEDVNKPNKQILCKPTFTKYMIAILYWIIKYFTSLSSFVTVWCCFLDAINVIKTRMWHSQRVKMEVYGSEETWQKA